MEALECLKIDELDPEKWEIRKRIIAEERFLRTRKIFNICVEKSVGSGIQMPRFKSSLCYFTVA